MKDGDAFEKIVAIINLMLIEMDELHTFKKSFLPRNLYLFKFIFHKLKHSRIFLLDYY